MRSKIKVDQNSLIGVPLCRNIVHSNAGKFSSAHFSMAQQETTVLLPIDVCITQNHLLLQIQGQQHCGQHSGLGHIK